MNEIFKPITILNNNNFYQFKLQFYNENNLNYLLNTVRKIRKDLKSFNLKRISNKLP